MLPPSEAQQQLDVLRLLTARSAEMMACEASVHLATARAVTQLQRLPVRLRRRAASHAPRRLPRRFHHVNNTHSTAKSLLKKAKRSRRYRRRPQRLAALALRRFAAPNNVSGDGSTTSPTTAKWLPTHLWHAKRFHMVENWGWRLPYAPTDKMFKALQRATTDRCMLLDQGYLSCFLLSGPSDLVERCLSDVTLPFFVSSPGVGAAITPLDSASTGFHEVVGLFCRDSNGSSSPSSTNANLPNISRAILGPVRILRAPRREPSVQTDARSRVWIWLHPSISDGALQVLQSLEYVADGRCKVADCTSHLCRLKLIGPFSHQVLQDILQPPSVENHEDINNTACRRLGDWSLWRHHLGNYAKAGLLPAGCAVGLICDKFTKNRPRLKLYNRNWLIPVPTYNENINSSNVNRDNGFTSLPLTWTELNKLRHDNTSVEFNSHLSGLLCPPESSREHEPGVPLLLIQNSSPPLASQKSQCVGWDVVLPRHVVTSTTVEVSAARDLVIACVYRGVRVGGLRDQLRWATLTTEAAARMDAFPYALWPDTPAAHLITDKLTHLKVVTQGNDGLTGDAKRRARIKFRSAAPSTKEWLRLIHYSSSCTIDDGSDAQVPSSSFFVLRDKALLVLVVRRLFAGDPRTRHLTLDHLKRYNQLLPRALIMVKLVVTSRGIPEPRSGIYIPLSSDDTSQGPITYGEGDNEDQKLRKLVGYVDEGGYAFSHGLCVAIGFISVAAFCGLKQSERPPCGLRTVLFRAPRSEQFYDAKLTVIV